MSPLDCESRIDRVVVYARGAVVTRRVELPAELPDEPVELRVLGVTGLALPGSVRALSDGGREVVACRTRLALPEKRAASGALAERLRAIELEAQALAAERRSAAGLRDALAIVTLDPAMARWSRRLDPAARFADALALSGLVGAETERLDARVRGIDEAMEKNRRARDAAALAAAQGTTDEVAGEARARLEVIVRLGKGGAPAVLELEYVVGEARWWPAYTARFSAAATRVSLAIDAFVAQASGEDWTRVKIGLSTADLAEDARLPELASLRLGRAQPAPRRGYRPLPEGLDAMFDGFDRVDAEHRRKEKDEATRTAALRRPASPPPPPQAPPPYGAPPPGSGAPQSFGAPPPPQSSVAPASLDALAVGGAPPPMAVGMALSAPRRGAAPAPVMPASSVSRAVTMTRSDGEGGGGAPPPPEPPLPSAIEPGDAWLDFDALSLADPADRAHRGRLVRAAAPPIDPHPAARAALESAPIPRFAVDTLAARGRFDHRYDAAGTSDVPSGGRPHRVAVAAADASATPRFVAVPREAPEVYREVEIENPFAAPLLSGPVDVFLDGALMTTSQIAFVDRRGIVHLGLGVEERLRVARNARVEEGTAGLLGGSAVIDHAITVDLASSLGRRVSVDVIERIPVTDEKDVDVKLLYARPENEKYTQVERGAPLRRALRFRVDVPAGERAKVELGYRVTLPSKNELLGGNRRE